VFASFHENDYLFDLSTGGLTRVSKFLSITENSAIIFVIIRDLWKWLLNLSVLLINNNNEVKSVKAFAITIFSSDYLISIRDATHFLRVNYQRSNFFSLSLSLSLSLSFANP